MHYLELISEVSQIELVVVQIDLDVVQGNLGYVQFDLEIDQINWEVVQSWGLSELTWTLLIRISTCNVSCRQLYC